MDSDFSIVNEIPCGCPCPPSPSVLGPNDAKCVVCTHFLTILTPVLTACSGQTSTSCRVRMAQGRVPYFRQYKSAWALRRGTLEEGPAWLSMLKKWGAVEHNAHTQKNLKYQSQIFKFWRAARLFCSFSSFFSWCVPLKLQRNGVCSGRRLTPFEWTCAWEESDNIIQSLLLWATAQSYTVHCCCMLHSSWTVRAEGAGCSVQWYTWNMSNTKLPFTNEQHLAELLVDKEYVSKYTLCFYFWMHSLRITVVNANFYGSQSGQFWDASFGSPMKCVYVLRMMTNSAGSCTLKVLPFCQGHIMAPRDTSLLYMLWDCCLLLLW